MVATSIEQSKKLLELGLDSKTADLYYWRGADLRIGGYKARDKELDIPAWSLDALLKLIPNYGIHNIDGKVSCVFYSVPKISPHPQYVTDDYNTLFDTIYDMISWLLVNKYL